MAQNIKALKAKRKSLGVSQEQLATMTGLDRSVIANIESGRRTLPIYLANLLDGALTAVEKERQRKLKEIEDVLGNDDWPSPEEQNNAIDKARKLETPDKPWRPEDEEVRLADRRARIQRLKERVAKLQVDIDEMLAELHRTKAEADSLTKKLPE